MNNSLAYRLEEGILLEDGDVLLGWNCSRDVLLKESRPETEELPAGRLGLLWRNRRWLGGMEATLHTSLRKNEHFRRVEVWPTPGRSAADEFQRMSRHLGLRIGTATRTSDRPGRLSHFWRRGAVDMALSLQGRSDRLGFAVSYRGPELHPTGAQGGGGQSFEQHLRRLGLTFGQWHELKNYLLDLQAGHAPLPPAALRDHPVVQLASGYPKTRDGASLDKAAAMLVGTANAAWLALDKS
jgi:hypothetical protein